MPWMIVSANDEHCIYKKGEDGQPTGKSLGCHPSREAAMKQMAALHANVKESNPMKTTVIIEALDLSEAQINAESHTVRQRLITAGKSKNNRIYSESVLQTAAPLFEGRQTFANHPSRSELKDRPERSIRDLTGWLSNVEYQEGALYAVRHFADTQAGRDAWALVEQIVSQKAPATLMGASINAVGKAKSTEDGALIIESIDAVHSVDDVVSPAAGGAFLAESAEPGSLTADLLAALTFEEWFESRPDYTKRLQNEMKQARQDDALKAARAEAEGAIQALKEAQSQLAALTSDREAAIAEAQQARRELEIERKMRTVSLPAAWDKALREQLAQADERQWASIIETELSKARSAGHRIAITGAEQQVNTPLPKVEPPAVKPIDMSLYRTPQELIEDLRRSQP